MLHKLRKVGGGFNDTDLAMLPNYVSMLQYVNSRYKGLEGIRKLTETSQEPQQSEISRAILDAKIIPIVLKYLQSGELEEVQVHR